MTFARLLCTLPALESIHLGGSCTFAKHGFDLRSVPVLPGLPSQLADVQLTNGFRIYSDPCSVTDLIEFFIATDLGKNLRRITACPSSISRAANEVDVALNRLIKHSAQSLHHLSLDSSLSQCISNDTYELLHADHSADAQSISIAPYFDVSDNTCLKRLDLTVRVAHEKMSHLCAPGVKILSQVTSTHISKIQVNFTPNYWSAAELDVDLEALMDGLPQLDAVLSGPIFSGLASVVMEVMTLVRSDVRDEDSAHELRLCLPTLDTRGILGIGMHWNEKISEQRCYGIERASTQDAAVPNTGTSADDDKLTNNATTLREAEETTDKNILVSEEKEYAGVPRPALSNLMDAQVPAASACDNEPVPQNAMAGLAKDLDIFAPDDHGDESSADLGSLV
ncbi:predicted protein [Postia placenta Mad-698-R]|nr:predicted protein [Postia placenta Mad-698-R]